MLLQRNKMSTTMKIYRRQMFPYIPQEPHIILKVNSLKIPVLKLMVDWIICNNYSICISFSDKNSQ